MLSLVVKGVQHVRREIEREEKQTRFAMAVALTRTARDAWQAEQEHAKRKLDNPTPFTMRGFRYQKATKSKLVSSVYIAPIQADYLRWQVEGGVRKGRSRKGEALPVDIPLNEYGNIKGRRGGKLRKLMARPDTFLGTINGTYGLWQRGRRTKAGNFSTRSKGRNDAIQLLVTFKRSVRYGKRLRFYDVANVIMNRRFSRQFDRAFAQAMATAR